MANAISARDRTHYDRLNSLCTACARRDRSIVDRGTRAIVQRHNHDTRSMTTAHQDFFAAGERMALKQGRKRDLEVGFREPRGG